MHSKLERRKTELIVKIANRAADKLEAPTGALAARFIGQLFADVVPDGLVEMSEEDLYGAGIGLLRFLQDRPDRETRLRVYNPTQDVHGWQSGHTVVEVLTDDMPFLVDSVTGALQRLGMPVHMLMHPVISVVRGEDGLVEIGPSGAYPKKGSNVSVIHVQVTQTASAEQLSRVEAELTKVLHDIQVAVRDWRAMLERADHAIEELKTTPPGMDESYVAEARAFMEWMRDNHFTFLGFREYRLERRRGKDYLRIVDGSGLGILSEVTEESQDRHAKPLSGEAAKVAREKQFLIITKASTRSTVHRPVYMDYIGLRRFDEKGEVCGEFRFIGLFTSAAYNRNTRDIPILRNKVQSVLDRAGFPPSSHNAKALLNVLESAPRDELFQMNEDQLFETTQGIRQLEERQRIRLFVRRDDYARFESCLVFVPRDRYTTALRRRFQDILMDAFDGESVDYNTSVTDSPLARVHFIVRNPSHEVGNVDIAEVERRLVDACESWSDGLSEALIEAHGEAEANRLANRYLEAFPPGYTDNSTPRVAVGDIERIEATLTTGQVQFYLYRPLEADQREVHLKVYHVGTPMHLSDILPMLENMGQRVQSEVPFKIKPADADAVWVHDFIMRLTTGEAIDLAVARERFEEAFLKVWHGEVENDGFNRLVLQADLHWRDVVILRAFAHYLRQAGVAFSLQYIQETLARNAHVTTKLVGLARAMFDPDRERRAANAEGHRLLSEIRAALDEITVLDEDRILRRFLNLVMSTLRTNYFQKDENGEYKPYLSIKLDSTKIDELPLPRPMREIFVYSPRVEAVHLRGGLVARGGLRWSDRREDFRTEVLGLMKAQMVKNAVIVPVGSKGGFVVKQPPSEGGREAQQAEGIACYKIFISGMLDITDNIVGGKVVPPPQVIRYDDDDPYLVVAADKGTATFSDIANGVSQEYGFWLDDAFASGGSAGYDHKKMGITARGAWESVKRHFREMGVDTQSQPFTVIGVGDMSGDVFGNGMLLSEHIKLQAAFNHRHIFLDPDPDPAKSYVERRRMFEEVLGWDQYNAKLISKGGGVFDRSVKSIPLSAEIKAFLGVKDDALAPNDVMRAILKAEVDLLWFGGIGTYVKASSESHSEAGDRANDALRLDAKDVSAKVIGEGANLGVTQLGRIEFAQLGGRINTDAVDNSAGVDCSDHEVNIKILLGSIVGAGDMTTKQRDKLLESMTDEVADLVLRDNYLQTQALSDTEANAPLMLGDHVRLMRNLERGGRLDREIEFLPDDDDVAERQAGHRGLTRPELSVLLAYAKMSLYDELLASDLPDDPNLIRELRRYFPDVLVERHEKEVDRHQLSREIIATAVTNSLVNRVGPTFIDKLHSETGRSGAAIARAYAITRDCFDMRSVWAEIEGLDTQVDAAVQTAMRLETIHLIGRCTRWFLQSGPSDLAVESTMQAFQPGIRALTDMLDEVLPADAQAQRDARAEGFASQGVPAALGRRVADLESLGSACDIVGISAQSKLPVERVGRIYFDLGSRFLLDWLRARAAPPATAGQWQKMAMDALVEDFFSTQTQLTTRVLAGANGAAEKAEASELIESWLNGNGDRAQRTVQLLSEMRSAPRVELAMLAVANRELRSLVGS